MFEHKAVIITISDKASRGQREDVSGPGLTKALKKAGIQVVDSDVVADEIELIADTLIHYADSGAASLILTTGGTGLSPGTSPPRPPPRWSSVRCPGWPRPCARPDSGTLPMPCSAGHGRHSGQLFDREPARLAQGLLEGLETILPALPHGLDKLMGDPRDCARQDAPTASAAPAMEYIVPNAGDLPRIIEEMEFLWHEAFMALPTATNLESPQVKWVNTGYPFAMINGAYDNNFDAAEMNQVIEQVAAEFEGQFLPFTWIVGPSSRPDNLGERLVARGFEREDDLTCMAMELKDLLVPEGWAQEIELNKVSNAEELREGVRIFTSSFKFPAAASQAPYEAYLALAWRVKTAGPIFWAA